MKNFLKIIGITVFFMVIGLLVASCELDYENTWDFHNKSSHSIKVDIRAEHDISPRSFTLSPGATRTVGSNTHTGTFWFDWERTDGNGTTGVRWSSDDMTFYNQ